MARKPVDGKIRATCPECGKRVKYPADMEGEAFRCPLCGATVIAGLTRTEVAIDDEPTPSVEPVRAQPAPPAAEPPPAKEEEKAAPAAPPVQEAPQEIQRQQVQPNKAISALCDFLSRENQRVDEQTQAALRNLSFDAPAKTIAAQILAIRRERNARLAEFVAAARKRLTDKVRELEQHPLRGRAEIQEQWREARKEYTDFEVFVRVMIGVEPPAAG